MEPTERKWMDGANRINSRMQGEAQILAKETAATTLIGYQHQLNSYAFYSKHLINSLARFLPYNLDKLAIDDLFIEKSTTEKKDIIP